MHRSGTSVTTNLLNAFGVDLSGDLMEASAANAKGYFESKEIVRIHDEILNELGMDWKTGYPKAPLPLRWWRTRRIKHLQGRLAGIAKREIARTNIWGFKDPRTARVLPVWNEIVRELDIPTRYVLAFRHPTDVAHSLRVRDEIDTVTAEKLWLIHNAEAIVHTRGKIDAMVDYDRWIEEPVPQAREMLDRLDLPWSGTPAETARVARDVVSPALRHNSVPAPPKLTLARKFYTALLERDRQMLRILAEYINQGALRTLASASGVNATVSGDGIPYAAARANSRRRSPA
jgi:hypothetical protein